MPSAGNDITTTTSPTTISLGNNPASAGWIRARTANTGQVLVNVPGLHDPGDFLALEAGVALYFKVGINALASIIVKGSDTSQVFDYGVAAREFAEATS